MTRDAGRVLLVDHDPANRLLVERLLRRVGHDVEAVGSAADGLVRVRRGFRGVIIVDDALPDRSSRDLVPRLREEVPHCPVIVLAGRTGGEAAPDAGACPVIEKDHLTSRLGPAVHEAFERLRESDGRHGAQDDLPAAFRAIVTRSPAMRAALHALQAAIDSRVPVLIRGASGTGKELVARALHAGGPRAEGPFLSVNCAGIPDDLLEAELFGTERGAIGGVTPRRPGRFDLAQRGTLLLDEIGEMHVRLQAKLVRVLEEGQFHRVGGSEPIKADVRVLSATHRELEKEVRAGRFREDLYYRLAVFTVALPPLVDREGDIPLLVDWFVGNAARREGKEIRGVERRALELLGSFSFPGNVRQLENVITHAVVTARGPEITESDLPAWFLGAVGMERRGAAADHSAAELLDASTSPREKWAPETFPSLADLERTHIVAALEVAEGNKALAARMLGISRMTLYRKIREHDLDIEISTIDESG